MISVVLYGRNDDHGYNLHKRVAISLNCIAELLADEADEIVFVDYNTPDDLPTLPEAIGDTLAAKTRRRLRILRVRPDIHARYAQRTPLPVLEAIARNVAVRRSNPGNRWILSTNGDMVFAPRAEASLSAIARELPAGLYHIPRFDLPEALWESFDRMDGPGTIEAVRHWGAAAHLDEVVRRDFVRYDCPGDFQLMPRGDLCRIGGFDERLIHGWHLDYNVAKRMSFLYGGVGDLAGELAGYHCDHTRRSTPTHEPDHRANSWYLAYDSVARAELPEQAESWGCPGDAIEEIRLAEPAGSRYLAALRASLVAPSRDAGRAGPGAAGGEKTARPHHVVPFLASLVAPAPRGWAAAWFGEDPELLGLFRAAWTALGFERPVAVPRELEDLSRAGSGGLAIGGAAEILETANVLLFDFAVPGTDEARGPNSASAVEGMFLRAIDGERSRIAGGRPARLFVCVDAVDNRYEQMVLAQLAAVHTPAGTRLRYGYVRPAGGHAGDWLARMDVGPAGYRDRTAIRARAHVPGAAAYGPRVWLPPGSYCARVEFTLAGFGGVRSLFRLLWRLGRVAQFCIAAGGRVLAKRSAFLIGPRRRSIRFEFSVAPTAGGAAGAADLEAWILTSGICDLAVSRLDVSPSGDGAGQGRA
ncbi:MAG: hypothetical protein JNM29_09610 [Candidatus Odyssella sp.]|nr:hypothetical protein [Candidatus Odyssella sp.]